MGKINSRDKGKRGEREVAELLRTHGFTDARRGQQFHGGPDSPDVVGLPGWHIEVKFTEALQLYAALEQADKESKDDDTSVVFHRRKNQEWVAILDLHAFLRLIPNKGEKP